MPFNATVAKRNHTYEHIARMESDKVISTAGGDAYGGGTFTHSTADKARWNGYEETVEPAFDRGWKPTQTITEAANKAAKAADAPWIAAGAADERNRLGPLKPHDLLVTAREDVTPIPPVFEDTVHRADGSRRTLDFYPGPYTNDGLVGQTNNLDYGSFSLPERNGMGSTGLIMQEDMHKKPVPVGRALDSTRRGPPAAARIRNRSSLKLAALPFTGHKDVYDTARWLGTEWKHPPPGEQEHQHHVASWATPAYKSSAPGKHPGNPIWKSTTTSLSEWRGEDNGIMSSPVENPNQPFKLGVTRKGGATGQGHGKGSFFVSRVSAARGGPSNMSSSGSRRRSRRGENRSSSADLALNSGRQSEMSYASSVTSMGASHHAGHHSAALNKSQMTASQNFARPGLRMSY